MLRKLEEENVISKCISEKGEFINTVFLREKKDSTPESPKFRMILNMKELNKNYVEYTKHKMHSLQTC